MSAEPKSGKIKTKHYEWKDGITTDVFIKNKHTQGAHHQQVDTLMVCKRLHDDAYQIKTKLCITGNAVMECEVEEILCMVLETNDISLCVGPKGGITKSDEDENIIQKMLFERNVSPQTLLAGYQQDILPWYQRAAIFVLSSRSEGQPMVLLEAMSQGCAPIATDNDNRTQEIITASSEGIICQTDALSIARALSRLLADSILRTQLQQGAVLRSFRYSSEQVVKRWEHLLESLTKPIHQ